MHLVREFEILIGLCQIFLI